jgi:hypothetical protein
LHFSRVIRKIFAFCTESSGARTLSMGKIQTAHLPLQISFRREFADRFAPAETKNTIEKEIPL